MTDRKALRQVLKAILTLSGNLDKNSLSEICKLVSSVSASMLEINLPQARPSTVIQDIYAASVYDNDQISCSVFGIQLSGGRIPLHDHCNCFGFIRVLRGSLKIKSFSLLDSRKESELILGLMSGDGDCATKARPVVYEGEQTANADDNSVLFLDPMQGNIHEVSALENDTAFFDVLIPGYTSPCIYYAQMPDPDTNAFDPKPGEICWLQKIRTPKDYYTRELQYFPIFGQP